MNWPPLPGFQPSRHRGLRLSAATRRTVYLPGRIACIVRGQLDINGPKLRRLARTTKRGLATELLELLHGRAAAHLQRSPDRAWRDSIDANPFAGKLLRKRFHIVHRCRFRLRVIIEVW